jgi:hypothetical protein
LSSLFRFYLPEQLVRDLDAKIERANIAALEIKGEAVSSKRV